MGRLKPFSNIFGAASRAVLQEFSSMEAMRHRPFHLHNAAKKG